MLCCWQSLRWPHSQHRDTQEYTGSFEMLAGSRLLTTTPICRTEAHLVAVREVLLQGGAALVGVQRPAPRLEEGPVPPALRLAVTALHGASDLDAFAPRLQVWSPPPFCLVTSNVCLQTKSYQKGTNPGAAGRLSLIHI